jgi:diguanylate cyclase (GGDEF)-like protein
MLGFVIMVEWSQYWQSHLLTKNIVFYALIIPAISYFIYVNKRSETFVDPLTLLPNRILFQRRFEQAIENSRRLKNKVALLFLDLNGFKQVNDNLGHDVGDELLKQVAIRLKHAIRDGDTLARLGGDEFAIILSNIKGVEAPVHIAENIIQKFNDPYHIDGKLVDVGVSIGISVYPEHSENMSDLLRYSDVAMYTAKKEHLGYAIYSREYNKTDLESLKIISDLRDAIQNDTLSLVYQPKVDIKTGKTDSFEALLRWSHPEHGHITPDKLITLAEDSNLINELTDWVINAAMKHCAEWERDGYTLNVSINVSARNLKNEKIMVNILSAIEKHRLQTNRVTLEITETSLATQSDMTIRNLIGLNMMGVCLSIDDFGTGHASLVYIQQLPVHEIKIDRFFVNNVLSSSRDRKIVQSIIHLAHDIDCKVVAEGVESKEIMQNIKEMGCDLIQGFWVSAPMSSNRVVKWLDENES